VQSPIPVGLVGAGKHGERYLRHILNDVPDLRVRLLCRRDERAGREQAAGAGAEYVADFRELAASPRIEAVIAVAPPTANVELCTIAAAAGKAVLVEKPVCTNSRGGAAIRAAVERAGVPLMVAHTLRFDSVVRTVRAHLERLGPIHQVCLSQRFEPSPLAWLDDPQGGGGGNLLHTGVHGFDLLRFLTGEEPRAVMAATRQVATRATEDNFTALFSFAGPLLASVVGSRATAGRSGAIEIAAERGQILADHVHGVAFVITGTTRAPLPLPERVPTVREVLRAFARALRDGSAMPVTLDDGLRAVAMAEACYRSVKRGRAEEIPLGAASGR
jgi:predicted dehydrogenase